MRLLHIIFGLAVLGAGTSLPVLAQTIYTPVTVTGFTDDVVANGAAPSAESTTADMDGGLGTNSFCYLAPDYVSPATGSGSTTALPASGYFESETVPGMTFQLQGYDQLNSLRLHVDSTRQEGTLTLSTPQTCTEVILLGASGNGANYMNVLITFSDGTTQATTDAIEVPDWFDGDNPAISGVSRTNLVTDIIDDRFGNPRLYPFSIPLDIANYGKRVASVTVTRVPELSGRSLNIMGITLGLSCINMPAGGVTVASKNPLCTGDSLTLSLTGQGDDLILSRQWQASSDGLSWRDIAGATDSTYSLTANASGQYRAISACGLLAGTSQPVAITVNPSETATLSYDSAAYCQTGQSAVPTVSPAGGRFRATGGLVIDSVTGVLDAGASQEGTGTVFYTSAGSCPGRAGAPVTVNAIVPASLSYSSAVYCQVGATPAPVLAPATGGSFTLPSGLNLDTATGIIDLAGSTPGQYVIAYQADAACAQAAQDTIRIEGSADIALINVIAPNSLSDDNRRLDFKSPGLTGYHLSIYNNWGKLIWQSDDSAETWAADGQSAGLYYYQVQYNDCTGQSHASKSWLEVAR